MVEKLNQVMESAQKQIGGNEILKQIKENWRLILVAAIVVAISLSSSLADKGAGSKSQNNSSSQNEQNQAAAGDQNATPTPTPQPSNNTQTSSEKPADNASSGDSIVVKTAQKGQGVTHLARQAVKEYIDSTGTKLSSEQKIYAEDYLKRQIGSKSLEVGQTVKFDKNMIKTGIEKAGSLTEKQIENLSKFVPLAKNL